MFEFLYYIFPCIKKQRNSDSSLEEFNFEEDDIHVAKLKIIIPN